jgi:hypothetical protein
MFPIQLLAHYQIRRLVLGLRVAVRILPCGRYPDQIEALTGWQRPLFTSVDVVVTGAVIGGGADGLHKIVKVFTTFFETTSAKIEAQKPAAATE